MKLHRIGMYYYFYFALGQGKSVEQSQNITIELEGTGDKKLCKVPEESMSEYHKYSPT